MFHHRFKDPVVLFFMSQKGYCVQESVHHLLWQLFSCSGSHSIKMDRQKFSVIMGFSMLLPSSSGHHLLDGFAGFLVLFMWKRDEAHGQLNQQLESAASADACIPSLWVRYRLSNAELFLAISLRSPDTSIPLRDVSSHVRGIFNALQLTGTAPKGSISFRHPTFGLLCHEGRHNV